MGLAAYGTFDEQLYELLKPLVAVSGLQLRQGCSDAEARSRLRELRSMVREPGSSPLQAADLAHTGQALFEELATLLIRNLSDLELSGNLALAGGCALNSAFNGQVLERTGFDALHVPSAPGDDGNALGAALLAYHRDNPGVAPRARVMSPFLGSTMDSEALSRLARHGAAGKVSSLGNLGLGRVADWLAEGKIVGWVQGRAEYGPRALGNRSILADPRDAGNVDRLNREVKFREAFRPFAPAILDEAGPTYFANYQTTPYMERALRFRPEVANQVPAVVHEDGTGRLQSVRRDWNAKFYDLIQAFSERSGVPILLNTSFNVMGKPIIHSVEDAVGVFATTGMDALVIEDVVLEK